MFFNQCKEYETFYTRLSRKLVYLPEVYFSKKYDRLFLETMFCDDFFSRLNLSCPESLQGKSVWLYKKQVEKYLFKNKDFNNDLKKDSLKTKDYLYSNGFNNDVYFIDLGWKGSIQDSLNIIFNKGINITG